MKKPASIFLFSLTSLSLGASGCWEAFPKGLVEGSSNQRLSSGTKTRYRSQPRVERFDLQGPSKLDLLFVVDNSTTMGSKQGQLARSISALVDTLKDPQLDTSFRIAVTSSDMGGHPTVSGCSQSDGGALLYRSCLDRAGDFVDVNESYSRFNTACKASCSLDSDALRTRSLDAGKAGQPWLELRNGQSNLEDQTLALESALACILPQGINGCGYESQLGAMQAALENAAKSGFMRSDASLAVIHVTDELDCSQNTEHSDFDGVYLDTVFGRFSQDFWVPGQNRPASATCFMAGSHCEGNAKGEYLRCDAVDRDLDRRWIEEHVESQAVLRPVSVYKSQLLEIRRKKRVVNPKAKVFVGLVGGVKQGSLDIRYRYADFESSFEESFYPSFGIGFGCEGNAEFLEEGKPGSNEVVPGGNEVNFAFPPIRIRSLIEAVNGPGRAGYASICAQDWGPQLAGFARHVSEDAGRSCALGWVADKNTDDSTFVPDCEVFEKVGDTARREVPECTKNEKGYVLESGTNRFVPPSGAQTCYLALTDSGEQATPDPYDDMSMSCKWSSNVEFRIVRKTGADSADAALYSASCRMWEPG